MIDQERKKAVRSLLVGLLVAGLSTMIQACGDDEQGAPPPTSTTWVHHWNQIAIDASGLDHTAVAPGEDRVFGEQFGPTRASRASAMGHLAIFDAVNAIAGGYQSYTGLALAPAGTSMKAAGAQAAHDTLAALFPSQAGGFDQKRA